MPQPDQAGDDEKAEAEREQSHGGLGADEQLAPVEMIGGMAGERQQQDLRSELQPHHDADRGGIVLGQLGQHDPVLRGALHPAADIGDERADGPDPVVPVRQ